MGTSLSSIHIFGETPPAAKCGFTFRSFSPGWQTCTENFSQRDPDYPATAALLISIHTDDPVLHFEVFDSEMIMFEVLRKGKVAARYSDDECVTNKKMSDIPLLLGCDANQKKRLSSLLRCSDVDDTIAMLEEYFGVCLLYQPDVCDDPQLLHRVRSDALYRKYEAEEKAISGRAAPIQLRIIAEYPGKLFWDFFGRNHLQTVKPHCFLYGYSTPDFQGLAPVRFTGSNLEPCNLSTFSQERIPSAHEDPRFITDYRTPYTVTFSGDCPEAYRGQTTKLPNGFYPIGFTSANELLLQGKHRIYVTDSRLKIIAKLSIRGDIADIVNDHILTTTGDSFCGYCFDPKAKLYIYEIFRK